MTSNLPEVVDDAILSRCTAHVHYDNPTEDEALRIWEIQIKLNKLKDVHDDVKLIISEHPYLAGRDIKNMCKMMMLYTNKRGGDFSIGLFKKLLPFMNFSFKAAKYKNIEK